MAFRLRRLVTMITLFSILGMLIVACGGGTDTDDGTGQSTTAVGTDSPEDTAATVAPDAATTTKEETATMATEETSMAMMEEAATTVEETATAMMEETATAEGSASETATTEGGAAAAGGPAMELPADCTNVELQYWNPFIGPDQPFMQQLVDSFNGENENIEVIMTAQSEYNTQLATASASGTLPDVAIINEDQVATQAFRNVIRPMGDVVQQMGLSASDFPEVAWNAGTVAGEQYGIPLSFVAMTMYYNRDLLTAAGLSAPPTNREEFEAAAAAMTQDGNNGFMLTTGFPVQQIFQQLLHQYGGDEFNEDGTEATWNSEAGVQALQWMVNAQQNYSQPNLEVDAELNAFKTGTVGTIWNGSWQIPNLTGDAVEFSGQIAPVPQIGDQPAVWAGGPLLTLPTRSGEADACKDAAAGMLIRYLIDNSAEWAKGGHIPAFNQAREDAGFTLLPQAALAESVENPVFPPSIPGVGDAFVPLSEALAAVVGGVETDIKAALDNAATTANQILAENQQNYGDAPVAP